MYTEYMRSAHWTKALKMDRTCIILHPQHNQHFAYCSPYVHWKGWLTCCKMKYLTNASSTITEVAWNEDGNDNNDNPSESIQTSGWAVTFLAMASRAGVCHRVLRRLPGANQEGLPWHTGNWLFLVQHCGSSWQNFLTTAFESWLLICKSGKVVAFAVSDPIMKM